jgi:hypothetical protein
MGDKPSQTDLLLLMLEFAAWVAVIWLGHISGQLDVIKDNSERMLQVMQSMWRR